MAEIKAIREDKGRKNKWRQLLYVVTIPLLLTEWALDLIKQIIDIVRKSIEILYLSAEKFINEPSKPKPSD